MTSIDRITVQNFKTQDQIIEYLKTKKYEDGISLITCTGDRPECMALCFNYILKQATKEKFQWIICDDSKNPYLTIKWANIELYQRQHIDDKVKSFIGNLREAILNIRYKKVIIIEDDDWYSPNYLSITSSRLDNYDLVGEAPARYYNVSNRLFKIWGNNDRASLCATALNSTILNKLYVATYLQTSPFVDYRLWKKDVKRKFIFQDKCHVVGIKGMPGRRGIGTGHRTRGKSWKFDKDLNELTKWIGQDAQFYAKFYKPQ